MSESIKCSVCGTELQPTTKFCMSCGSELIHETAKTVSPQPFQQPAVGSVGSFNMPLPFVYFHWIFPDNRNAVILNSQGTIIFEIERKLVPLGIEYSLIDAVSKETISMYFSDETHFEIVQNNQRVGFVEIRKVKDTIELKDLADNIEAMTEKDGFIKRKTLYEGNNDDVTMAYLKPMIPEKVIGNMPPTNLYELEIKRQNLGMRKILVFALFMLIYFRSNPYR